MAYIYLLYLLDNERSFLKELKKYIDNKKDVKILESSISTRRKDAQKSKILEAGAIKGNEKLVSLTKTEYLILELLEINAGQVLEYDFIYEVVWGEQAIGFANKAVQRHITNIQSKLKKYGKNVPFNIKNIRGLGYVIIISE